MFTPLPLSSAETPRSGACPAPGARRELELAAEALHLINASRSGRMEPAYVAKAAGPFGLGGVTKASSQRRSNTLHWMPHDDSPEIWALVQRIVAIVGIPSTHAERLQVIRYGVVRRSADTGLVQRRYDSIAILTGDDE